MKPVDQTFFGPEEGNCLQACIASLFELPLEDVPHFVLEENWVKALDDWLIKYDLQSVDVDLKYMRTQDDDMWMPSGYHLICGESSRECSHAVVGYKGKIVHDPHPDRDGLVEEQTWTLFVKRFDENP